MLKMRQPAFLIPCLIGLVACLSASQQGPVAATDREKQDSRFRFRLVPVDLEKPLWKLQLENAPPWVHALEMAPAARESELNQGKWIIIAFSVSSAADTQCIPWAVSAVAPYCGRVQLGIRPLWNRREITAWFPEYGDRRATPVWILLDNGKVQGWKAEKLTEKETTEFLASAFPAQ
jgi:hypothetical protein